MPLTSQQTRRLRALAHHLKPVVMLGQHGLSAAVMNEVDIALDTHELIKIKLGGMDKPDRQATSERIAARADAEIVQQIGHMLVLYRAHPERPRIQP